MRSWQSSTIVLEVVKYRQPAFLPTRQRIHKLSRAVLRREDSDDPSARRVTIPNLLESETYDGRTRWPKGFDPEDLRRPPGRSRTAFL